MRQKKLLTVIILISITIVGFCPKEADGKAQDPEFGIKNSKNGENVKLSDYEKNENVFVYFFGVESCNSCEEVKNSIINNLKPSKMKYYQLSEEKNTKYYQDIYKRIFPNLASKVPLVGVIQNGKLVAVTGGYEERYLKKQFWDMVVKNEISLGYYNGENYEITNPAQIKKLFLKQTTPESQSFKSLILPVATAAIADSINPCAFSLFIIFITILVTRLSKGVLKTGFSFIVGVFTIYFFLGFGLRHVFGAFSIIKYFVAAFGISVGLLQMSNLWLNHGITLVPDRFTEEIRNRMGVRNEEESQKNLLCEHCGPGIRDLTEEVPKSSAKKEREGGLLGKVTSPIGGLILGIATATLLLPCTSGPYFVAISFISRAPFKGIFLLFLYNLIFILPFVAILVSVDKLSLRTAQVRDWWGERGRLVEFLSGLAIFILSVYLIFF